MLSVYECHSAAEVLARAAAVHRKRRTIFAPPRRRSAPKPATPAPFAVTSLTGSVTGRLMVDANAMTPVGGVTVKIIQSAVCAVAGVTLCDLLSERRTKNVVVPRHIAIALSKHFTHRSLPDIGRRFGDRDHTTVLHAVNKLQPIMDDITQRLTEDDPLETWVVAAFEAYGRINPKVGTHGTKKAEQP